MTLKTVWATKPIINWRAGGPDPARSYPTFINRNPDVSGKDLNHDSHLRATPRRAETDKLGSSTIDLYTPADPDFL